MASSMLTGEKRWLSARRGGMTVLGKVAVPKPINLPSQRSENHGLDPNVEIVPKGTLNWGSRSSTASNPWGSPPNAGPGAGSPLLNSRPSSGGTGTRPSTAGSDKSHEPAPSAWGSSSRPSSASGVFVSNQSSTGTRPRSADTRPGSSQLSRFAEPVSENSGVWGSSGHAEKLGHSSSKTNAFSLSSGDFPTLGTEKDTEADVQEDHSSQGRPVSASGVATRKENLEILHTDDESMDANRERGTLNSWRRESGPYNGGPPQDHWQREHHPFPNPSMPPQHFDPWHGSVRAPDGVWYRPTGVSPYGPPQGPPGNYPVEQFAYYHPHLPARPLPNSQAAPRPGNGPSPGGYHLKSGDSYRPHMPDSRTGESYRPHMPDPRTGESYRPHMPDPRTGESYHPHMPDSRGGEPYRPHMPDSRGGEPYRAHMPDSRTVESYQPHMPDSRTREPYRPHMPDSYVRPVMPVRPVYPGQVPYDGYYGPPQVMCNSGERDAPVMATGPCVYGGYPIQNVHPDSGKFHARPGGFGPTSTAVSMEHVESGHPQGSHQGPYKVLLKQHDGWEGYDGNEKREQEHAVTTSSRSLERGSRPGTPMKDNMSGSDRRNVESVDSSKNVPVEVSSQSTDSKLNTIDSTNKVKEVDDGMVKKPEVLNVTKEELNPVSSIKRNPEKGLNYKARTSDERNISGHIPTRDEKVKPARVVNAKAEQSTVEANHAVVLPENTSSNQVLASTHDSSASAGDKRPVSRTGSDSAATRLNSSGDGVMSRSQPHRRAQGVQGRPDNRGRGRSSTQEGEEWRQKSLVAESSVTVPMNSIGASSNVCQADQDPTQEVAKKSETSVQGKLPMDSHATSAFDSIDYKEQRAKMKEIAAQRAKQLQKEEEERIREQKAKALAKLEELNKRALADNSTEKLDNALPLSMASEHQQDPVAKINLPLPTPPQKDVDKPDSNKPTPPQKDVDKLDSNNNQEVLSQGHDTLVVKQKQMGYKRKQNNVPVDKNLSDKPVSNGKNGGIKSQNVVADVNASVGESSLPSNPNNCVDDPTPLQKKKNSRTSKNKQKLDEASSGAPLPSSVPYEGNAAKGSDEIAKHIVWGSLSESNLVRATSPKDTSLGVVISAEHGWSPPTEESHGRGDNHWKPQAPRRTHRSAQGYRPTEKAHGNEAVIWTPVRSLNKNEVSDEPTENVKVESQAPATNGSGVQNHQKSKRAEMERYVPKQLSQQGNSQRPSSPSVNKAVSSETTVRAESGSPTPETSSASNGSKGGPVAVSKNGETKNSKYGKTQGLWRQRGSMAESHVVHSSQEASSISSIQSKTAEKPIEQPQAVKSEILLQEQPKDYDNWDDTPCEPPTVPVVAGKDHGGPNRGRRQQFKGNKVTSLGHNASDRNNLKEEMGQSDGKTMSVDNHGTAGDHSHWQPKSQPHPVPNNNNRQGNRAQGGRRASSQVDKSFENDFPAQSGNLPALRNEKDTNAAASFQHRADQSNTGVPRKQEAKKVRKDVDSSKDPVHSQTGGQKNSARVVVPENADTQNDQSFSPGPRKHGQHNDRTGRGGHEVSHGGYRNSAVQDNSKHQQQPSNNDRRRNNSHHEYQPARAYSNEPSEPFEGGGGSSRGTGSRYRERGGHSHSRRGGSYGYGRSSGSAEVGASYGGGNGE
ncbi:hypothetical protein MKW94_009885 [Papaver nudicaule]|uniref:BAT2 N-terminal domain-containing protein n=1 Tax=Papaver nudicaule TaxID=74823 RepID=A0AA41RUR4_PAPNU|nr:hypothetical protein [Papaver nudicaule]